MNRAMRERLLATTIIAGAAMLTAPAYAQTTPPATTTDQAAVPSVAAPAAAAPAQGGEIIVTGSRIPTPNLTSISPVTVVSPADIKLQGTTRVEDLLNSLPQVFGGQSSGLSNGADGTATVDLRDLGPTRTLVLVNGRRIGAGDPGTSAADLNFIPSSLIKRVEVLTGGASSTYGADAVAGVVNFIMDTNYSGFKIDGQYSLYQHDNRSSILRGPNDAATAAGRPGFGYPNGNVADGGTVDVTATMGAGFDDGRGHVVGYFGYRKVKPVFEGDRDYTSCTPQANAKGVLTCGGSATSAAGNIIDSTSSSYHFAGNGANHTLAPGLTRYNFAPVNYLQRPDERYTAGFFGHYDINDAIKPYAEFMFMDDRTKAQIAPSGDFGNTLTVNCDNPLLSAQQFGIVCRPDNLVNGFLGTYPLTPNTNTDPNAPAKIDFTDPTTGAKYQKGYMQLLRRNVEGGGRIADLQHTDFHGVIGTKGDLDDAWSYDASYGYSRTVYAQTYLGEFSVRKLNNALDVVTDTRPGSATNGQPVCRSVLDNSDPNCVPYNVFTPGSISPGALNYVSETGFQRGVVSEQVADLNFVGQLGKYGIKSPWANDGVAISIGTEYRKESLELNVDEAFRTGDLTGQGGATLPISGSFHVIEGFGELQVPIVQDGIFKDLSLNAGYRYSHYVLSTGGGYNTNTWKVGAEFAPIKDIRIRGGFNRAVRAPNLQELFGVDHVALDGSTDPCAGDVDANGLVNGNTAAQCAFTGVTAAQFGKISENPAAQYNGNQGGNPNLKPEVANTITAGVVLQPSFIRNLAVTVDYYNIKVKKAIQGFGADTIITTCVAGGDPTVCGLIHRNPANGSLWLTPDGYIQDLQTNVGSVKTSGIDLGVTYGHELGRFGKLGFNMNGTWLAKFKTDNGISTPYDCVGYFGNVCGTPVPEWRHKARVTYTAPNGMALSLQWRYFSKVKVDASSDNDTLHAAFSPFGASIASQSYFDLSASTKVGDHLDLRLGVNNLMDRRPPLINSNGSLSNCPGVYCNGGTFPGVYDALGRYIYFGATVEF